MAIAVLETGGFTSKRMMKTHNWFGFRANARHYQKTVEKGYGVYTSAEMMLKDYADFETEIILKYGLNTESAFRKWINLHYAEDAQYREKLASTLQLIERTWH